MQFSYATIIAAATMLLGAQTALAAPAPEAAELEGHLQGRAALLVCQLGGLFSGGGNAACSAECVAKGKTHGGYCDSHSVCICNPS